MRTITVEEHYATPAFMDGPGRQLAAQAEAAREHPRVAAGYATLIRQLCDLGDGRIAAMDAAGIDVQVLSLTSPGVEQLDATDAGTLARAINDRLADAVRRHPGRLAGFAALPTAAPEAAAEELERTVRDHGLKGALSTGTLGSLPGRRALLADPGARRGARGPAVSASHPAARSGDHPGVRRELPSGGDRSAGHRGLGLAHRHRHPRAAPDP